MKKNYISFLKFISIILVICIHLLSRAWQAYPVTSNEFKILTFIDSICLICVPIFLMCSGAIFLNRDDSYKKILFKYMLRIYIIAVIFGFLYRFADIIIYQKNTIDFNIMYNIIKQSILLINIYHLWYLKVILAMYLTIPLFKYLLKLKIKYVEHYILVFLIFIFQILPALINMEYFGSFIGIFGYLTYFYLGYYLDKYNNKKIVSVLFITFILSYIYMTKSTIDESIIGNIHVIDYMNYQSINILFMSSFIFSLFRLLSDKFNNKKFISIVNKSTFYIYLCHGFVIGVLSHFKVIDIYNYSNIFKLFLYTILVYVVTYIITYPIVIIKNRFYAK